MHMQPHTHYISMRIADATPGYNLGAGAYTPPKQAAPAGAAGGNGQAPSAVHGELCELYSRAMERMEAVGRAGFFGEECAFLMVTDTLPDVISNHAHLQ